MTPDVAFRPATEADLPAIVAMLADDALGAEREDATLPLDKAYTAAFRAIDADADKLLLVADRDGEVVGCLQLTVLRGLSRKGMRRGLIEAVRVERRWRGAGIGSALIEQAAEECRRRGCGVVQLTTDRSREDAHRFYARLGFTPSHLGFKLAL